MRKNKIDQFFKHILRYKIVLAHIMKDYLEEYMNYSIPEIMECIEPKGDVPLHKHTVSGHRNENNEDDTSIFFDSLVYASLPQNKGKIAMILNLEAQGELKGRSHVLSRANYYNSRNTSMQVEELFDHACYDDIVKVVSIWIVFNAVKYKQGSINRYRMVEEHIIGDTCEEEKYFDKQQIVVLYLGYKESEKVSMNILRVLADNMSSQEKIERLKKYDVELTKKQEEEVSRMCDYGAYVESIGIEKGIKEGLKQGSENKTIEAIQSLTKTLKLSVDEAMDALQISAEEKSYYLKLLNEKVNA
ncbi:hypothetical protein [Traorella massiliensis]|uniref:hypothetical protein n=1 Tax=Traorella massiliensis TaxID=1903263 RepID=UPI0008F8484A|nr:hypothetical protein [Traorella massiliensis]